jgi:putative DNA primase/helicase
VTYDIMASAPELVAALAGRWHGHYGTARCPAHDDRTPSLSVRETSDGKVLVRCFAGCRQDDVIEAFRCLGLWPDRGSRATSGRVRGTSVHTTIHYVQEQTRSVEVARRLWRSAVPAGGTLVEIYLRHRGIEIAVPSTLRFHANLRHPSGFHRPGLVAAVMNHEADTALVAVHRTFLSRDGLAKAPVDPKKMMLGPCRGGAVRLAPAGERLAIAEGLETGLSVMSATGVPTWAALSAGGVRSLVLPPLPLARQVTICADHDPAGVAAAHAAAERWHREGRQVRIAMPPEPGTDFNDLALATELAS